jgi:anti-sigma-K factor RskA
VEHVDELIAAHALHALEPAEERQVEQHVAECGQCRDRLREMEAVAATLAYAAPAAVPPPELRDRVMAAIGPVVAAPPPAPEPRRRSAPNWWPRFSLVAVPALAAAVLALGVWNLSLRGQVTDQSLGIADGRVVALAGVGNALVSPSGAVKLYVRAAPAPSGKTYEAWVIDARIPYPAGTFDSRGAFSLTREASRGDTIAVTIEPAGGSSKPTTTPIAAGKV